MSGSTLSIPSHDGKNFDGYVVLAPDVFWRQEPAVDLNYDEAGTKKAFALMQGLNGPDAVADLVSSAQALRRRSGLLLRRRHSESP